MPPDQSRRYCGLASAASGLIRFGGVLKDAGGKQLHGVQDVTFSLYAIEAGGEPLWFETQTVEVDAQGRYSINRTPVGFTNTAGFSAELRRAAGRARNGQGPAQTPVAGSR